MNRQDVKQRTVLVIDYGVGNHESVTNALTFLNIPHRVSSASRDITDADSFILPGVGAFEEAMGNLTKRGIIDTLTHEVRENKKPILGICLGMQVLAEDSVENGYYRGLGLIPGHVVRIPAHTSIRIPHVGWNEVTIQRKDPLFSSLPDAARFYFDHSYHFQTQAEYTAATCTYGSLITAAVQRDNIFGVQFHPEKSQTNGLRFLRAFFNHVQNTH